MTKHVRCRGFTFAEVLIVVAMSSVLAAISLPNFFRAEKRARAFEAVKNLKSLHASMSMQQLKPTSIHVPGFDPKRRNRYSYHLSSACAAYEDRSAQYAVVNAMDECIGVDTFHHLGFPDTFAPMPIAAVSWEHDAIVKGMGAEPGVFGSDTDWDYLAAAAGDLDDNPVDWADTWIISSADGEMYGICTDGIADMVPAGEPYQTNDDTGCN